MAVNGVVARHVLSVFAAGLLAGCAAKKLAAPSPSPRPYTAALSVRIRTAAGERSFSAGCAVDPKRGARVEIRDPAGSARLLLLLRPSSAAWVDPALLKSGSWTGAGPGLPWGPDDLWLALSGIPSPSHGEPALNRAGRLVYTWLGPQGKTSALIEGWADPPHTRATIKGPGRARLDVLLKNVLPAQPPAGFLDPPPLPLERADPAEILEGLVR